MVNVPRYFGEFQSTLPRGSDHIADLAFHHNAISIHAPSRERPLLPCPPCVRCHFNPRSLAGATPRNAYSWRCWTFQSTLPRGSDVSFVPSLHGFVGFQSTLPRGSDNHGCRNREHRRRISIHAPSRERPYLRYCDGVQMVFQSTLPRGSD